MQVSAPRPYRPRRRLAIVATLLVAAAVASAGASVAATPSAQAAAPPRYTITALGDSVPGGTACRCTPYPQRTAAKLSALTHTTVPVKNHGVAGIGTSWVLRQLNGDGHVINDVKQSNIVLLQIGGNDIPYSNACDTTVTCYTSRLPRVQQTFDAIIARIKAIRAKKPTTIVLLDYWSVWLGGKYAAAEGADYVAAAKVVTDQFNQVVKSEAAKTGSAYVDLRAAFKGPNYTYDETHYLAVDGDHPNAQGHEKIAVATFAVLRARLHI